MQKINFEAFNVEFNFKFNFEVEYFIIGKDPESETPKKYQIWISEDEEERFYNDEDFRIKIARERMPCLWDDAHTLMNYRDPGTKEYLKSLPIPKT